MTSAPGIAPAAPCGRLTAPSLPTARRDRVRPASGLDPVTSRRCLGRSGCSTLGSVASPSHAPCSTCSLARISSTSATPDGTRTVPSRSTRCGSTPSRSPPAWWTSSMSRRSSSPATPRHRRGSSTSRARVSVPVIDVIEPGARSLVEATTTGRAAVIGTVGTVSSGAYVRAVDEAARLAGREVTLTSAACPGFVEFVERGQTTGDEVTVLAERLLAPICAADVDALLFGCTHYPYLARVITDVVGAERDAGQLGRRDGVRRRSPARRSRSAAAPSAVGRAAPVPVERRRRDVPRARLAPARSRARARRAVAARHRSSPSADGMTVVTAFPAPPCRVRRWAVPA